MKVNLDMHKEEKENILIKRKVRHCFIQEKKKCNFSVTDSIFPMINIWWLEAARYQCAMLKLLAAFLCITYEKGLLSMQMLVYQLKYLSYQIH